MTNALQCTSGAGRVFGADADSVVMQTEYVVKTGRYAARGTLNEWCDNIAGYAVGNDLLALAISGALCRRYSTSSANHPEEGICLDLRSQAIRRESSAARRKGEICSGRPRTA